jgi:hypothetical protein
LENLLKKLVLVDEELDDVVIPRDDFMNLREEARWMAVVRVHTDRHFSNQPFFQKMDVAWGFAKKWSIRPVEDNLFILQVSCLGDWNRVMNDGPWIFRQLGVLIEPYDGIVDPSSVVLDHINVWIQVRGVPPLFRKEEIVRDMAARIGEVKGVDLYALGASGTSFVRVRVRIDVNKRLLRFVRLHPEGNERISFQVMYEKLPRFCDICGYMGHGDQECGDGVHEEGDKQYGSWMVAPVEDWHPQTSGVQGRTHVNEGSLRGRGGGRGGRREGENRKRPSEEKSERVQEGAGAGINPRNETPMSITDGKVQPQDAEEMEMADDDAGVKSGTLGPISPVKPPVSKKPKNVVTSGAKAGSSGECRQEQ